MAEPYFKILGQASPGPSGTYSIVYATPFENQALISTIVASNTSGSSGSFNIAVVPSPISNILNPIVNPETFIYFAVPIGSYDTFTATLGITLRQRDQIMVSSTTARVSFNVYGVELPYSGSYAGPPAGGGGGPII